MKKIFLLPAVVICLLLLSCKKDSNTLTQTNASALFNTEANWAVTNFIKNGNDVTGSYSTSKILFSPDNTLAVSNDALAITGIWAFGSATENTLNLLLNNPDAIVYEPWKDLQGDWKISAYTTTTISLQSNDNSKSMRLEKLPR